MADQELNLILRLRDEATAQLKTVRGSVTAAAGVMAAAGLKAGADWDKATKTIVAGTGATGKQLQALQKDYQAVARFGSGASTAVADLNTHLGLQGKEMREVAAAALKMGVNTNLAGDVMSQLGLDADGAVGFLDDLQASAQATGVSADQLLNTIGKSSARFQAAGGSVEDLTALVVAQAHEFGPAGLRGAMSEVMREVDKGVIPTVASLRDQLGETTGAVERTYQAGKTWRDVLTEQKEAAIAYLGPAGDMLAGVGSLGVGLAQVIPMIKNTRIAQMALNLAMKLNPIGLVVTVLGAAALGIYKWREEIMGFLSGAWDKLKGAVSAAKAWLEPLMGWFGGSADEVERLSDELAGHSLTTALAAVNKVVTPAIANFRQMAEDLRDVQAETRNAINDFVTLKGGVQGIGESFRLESTQINTGLIGLRGQTTNIAKSTGQGWLGGFFDQITGQGDQQGGFMGRMAGFMQTIQGGWQGLVTGALNMVPVVGPLLAAFGPALMKGIGKLAGKVWGGIKGLLTGRGAKIIELHVEWLESHRDTLKQIEGHELEVQRNIANGWKRRTQLLAPHST